MESGGMIRCTQCGYKNSPVYHYCGVCGAVLQAAPKEETPVAPVVTPAPPVVATPGPPAPVSPAPAPPRASRSDLPVSGGMSFLGLNDSPSSSSSSYLLDDEDEAERSVAWGRIFVVLILLGVAGGLGWQRYRGGYPFAPHAQSAAAPAPASTPVAAPAESPNPAASTPAAPEPSAETPSPEASKAADPAASAPAIIETSPPVEAKTETPAETKATPTAAAQSSEPAPVKKAPPVAIAEKTAPARVKTPPPAPEPPAVPGESFYVQGLRYLYGTGGAQANCDLALKSLMAAATRSHAKAQSTLGTMYSTGHCVTRDLPSAYRWFAKALHQDPNNTRLEQDLSVVWRQMTPGEQQLAIRKE